MVAALSPSARTALRQELDRQQPPAREEGVAVIGLGLRLPGRVNSLADFWDFLERRGDGVGPVPPDRWDTEAPERRREVPGAKWGGFIEAIDSFDAQRFGISPVEARSMDPQQRHLLEVTAEAIAHAGLREHSLRGSRTGVFMGLSSNDHLSLGAQTRHPVDAYTATGNPHSVAVGRLSYVFDLRGPCLAIDTACSSSLVAVDAAFHSLREGRCDLALAGGVHLMLDPRGTSALGAWSMLSPEGKCKAFDRGADGFVRGEGSAVLVLKRLRDAVADGDRIWSVIVGSAVNQDGRSNGLTAPNVEAQIQVMRDALHVAGIEPSAVGLVETHGTGTPLGDPVEFTLVSSVYRHGSNPCYLGALKTNVGHLEAASGAAGLAKAVLCLHRGEIPPNLHFKSWHPAIEAAGTRFTIPQRTEQFPGERGERAVAVSGFGFGGTNAHVVVREAPDQAWPSVWVFPGQGGQFAAMGRRFLGEEPGFAACVDAMEIDFQEEIGFSLRAVLDGRLEASGIAMIQPALFGFQVAAATMLLDRVGPPVAVIGHSMGEVAAAVTAGLLTIRQGLRVIGARSRLMQRLPAGGGMAVVGCAADEVATWADPSWGLEIAAHNAPAETVVAGDIEAIDLLVERCAGGLGPTVRAIRVDVASHSSRVESVLAALTEELDDVTPGVEARFPVHSTVERPEWNADHWARNLRGTVLFKEAVDRALASGATRFLEVSPHPVLAGALESWGPTVQVRAVQVRPPTWRHEHFSVAEDPDPVGRARGLLDAHVVFPRGQHVVQGDLGTDAKPWLADHALYGVPVAPGAALIEASAAAAECQASGQSSTVDLGAIALLQLMTLERSTLVSAHVDVTGVVRITSGLAGDPPVHVTAKVLDPTSRGGGPAPLVLPSGSPTRTVEPRDLYAGFRARGQEYGAAFQVLATVVDHGDGWVSSTFEAASPASDGSANTVVAIDAALQMMAVALPDDDLGSLFVPASVERFWMRRGAVLARAVGRGRVSGEHWVVDIDLLEEGSPEPAASLRGVQVQYLGRSDMPMSWGRSFFDVAWHPQPHEPTDQIVCRVEWVALGNSSALAELRKQVVVQADPVASTEHVVIAADVRNSPPAEEARVALALLREVVDRSTTEGRPTRVTIVVLGDPQGPLARTALSVVRTVSLEEPSFAIRAVVSQEASPGLARWLGRVWPTDVIWLDGESVHGARCSRALPPPVPAGPVVRSGASYLVTGATGGLGSEVIEWLLAAGAGRVVVNARRDPQPGTNDAFDRLRQDPRIILVPGDIAAEGTAEHCVEAATHGGQALRGVIHAAGVIADAQLGRVTPDAIARVWLPKVAGLQALDAACGDSLDFLVAFSTAGAVLGAPGQIAYAAANAAMDGLVARRRDRGLPGLSIAWGRWGEVGLAAGAQTRLMDWIAPRDGIAAMERLLASGRAANVVARLNEAALVANFPQVTALPFYTPLLTDLMKDDGFDLSALMALPQGDATREVHHRVAAIVARLMGFEPTELALNVPLTSLGLDSLLVLRVARSVKDMFGVSVGVASVMQGITVTELADLVSKGLFDAPSHEVTEEVVATAERRASTRSALLEAQRRRRTHDG